MYGDQLASDIATMNSELKAKLCSNETLLNAVIHLMERGSLHDISFDLMFIEFEYIVLMVKVFPCLPITNLVNLKYNDTLARLALEPPRS